MPLWVERLGDKPWKAHITFKASPVIRMLFYFNILSNYSRSRSLSMCQRLSVLMYQNRSAMSIMSNSAIQSMMTSATLSMTSKLFIFSVFLLVAKPLYSSFCLSVCNAKGETLFSLFLFKIHC